MGRTRAATACHHQECPTGIVPVAAADEAGRTGEIVTAAQIAHALNPRTRGVAVRIGGNILETAVTEANAVDGFKRVSLQRSGDCPPLAPSTVPTRYAYPTDTSRVRGVNSVSLPGVTPIHTSLRLKTASGNAVIEPRMTSNNPCETAIVGWLSLQRSVASEPALS